MAGRGYNTNFYTGSTLAGRGVAAYDPRTGIAVAGGAGYAGNIYSGQGVAGRGGIAYNTNTGAGLAKSGNNVYAGKDGNVYRYNSQIGNWSENPGKKDGTPPTDASLICNSSNRHVLPGSTAHKTLVAR